MSAAAKKSLTTSQDKKAFRSTIGAEATHVSEKIPWFASLTSCSALGQVQAVLVAQCRCELRPVQLEEFVDLYLSVSIDRVERALFFLDGAEKVVEPGGQQDWRGQRHGQRQCQQHALLSGWDCYRRRLDTWLYWLWLWLWIRCLWLRLPRREFGARGPRDASRSAGISAAASSSCGISVGVHWPAQQWRIRRARHRYCIVGFG